MSSMPSMRRSPLHDALLELQPVCGTLCGMAAPLRFPGDAGDYPLGLSDASCLQRMGVKGPQAESWLRSVGIDVPPEVNAWTRSHEGVLVARLARSEFFLEDRFDGVSVERLRTALQPAPGVYPVLRQDAALVVTGESANDLLRQTCNVDFGAAKPDQQTVVMTSMIGVSVLVLWHALEKGRCYRIWCDGTFGPYLWETLLQIATELGGGAIGLSAIAGA